VTFAAAKGHRVIDRRPEPNGPWKVIPSRSFAGIQALGELKMNWNQIERKWEEMTRRIQPSLALPSTVSDRTAPGTPDISSASGPADRPNMIGDRVATEPAV